MGRTCRSAAPPGCGLCNDLCHVSTHHRRQQALLRRQNAFWASLSASIHVLSRRSIFACHLLRKLGYKGSRVSNSTSFLWYLSANLAVTPDIKQLQQMPQLFSKRGPRNHHSFSGAATGKTQAGFYSQYEAALRGALYGADHRKGRQNPGLQNTGFAERDSMPRSSTERWMQPELVKTNLLNLPLAKVL